MAANPTYGKGFLELSPQLERGFEGKLSNSLGGLGGIGKKAGMLLGGALVAGAGAAVAGGVKSILNFASFEKGLNEVFTLMPDMTDAAMFDMKESVKEFANEFSVLPDEVLPALYQAISAGVPQDNVFSFLETAQKAALGGVTDLETAVDGISSVVNAYGSDVLSAAEASDLMFTAVRLGKTDFSQLSASLFQVIPTASALGVEFGDVTAALATMTAQGTPTSVATTQLRQLFVELSKAGGAASGTFERMAGKTFQEFIAEGGNVADALVIMQDAATESGVQLQDMFGSVEAGAAALSLAGGDSFTNNLAAMNDAAGATEAAYDQMNQGLSVTWAGIKTTIAVAMLDIGDSLAPFVQKFSDVFAEKLPGIVDGVFDLTWGLINTFERIAPIVGEAFSFLGDLLAPVVEAVQHLFGVFQEGEGAVDGLTGVFESVFGPIGREIIPAVVEAFTDIWTILQEAVIPAVTTVMEVLVSNLPMALTPLGMIRTILGFVADNAAILRPLIVGLVAGFLAFKTVATILGLVKGAMAALNVVMALNPIGLIVAALVALVAGLIYAWNNFDGFRKTVLGIWDSIKRVFSDAADFIIGIWDAVVGFFKGIWDILSGDAEEGTGAIRAIIDVFMGVLTGDWSRAWEGIKTILSGVWDTIKGVVSNAWTRVKKLFAEALHNISTSVSDTFEDVVQWFKDLPGKIVRALGDLGSLLWNAGKDLITGLWNGIKSMGTWLADKITGWITDKIPGPIAKALGMNSPSKVTAELGRQITEGLAIGMADMRLVERAALNLATAAVPPMSADRASQIYSATARTGVRGFDDPYVRGGITVNAVVHNPTGEPTEESIGRALVPTLTPYLNR